MGDDVQQLRTELRAEIRDGNASLRDHFNSRFDDAADARDRMHLDNMTVSREIRDEQRKTNGRVTALEVLYTTMLDRCKVLEKRWHDFRDSIQAKVYRDANRDGNGTATGENRTLTMRDMYVFVGGLSAAYFVAKVFKWLP